MESSIISNTVANIEMQEEANELFADESIPELNEKVMNPTKVSSAEAPTEKDEPRADANSSINSTNKKSAGKNKALSVEEIRKHAHLIAQQHKAGELKDNSIRVSEVCEMANCNKVQAKEIIYTACEIAKDFIKRIDDSVASSTTYPHVNKQKSLIIPAKTMQDIKDSMGNMLFPEGTQFKMEHDADSIILTKIA